MEEEIKNSNSDQEHWIIQRGQIHPIKKADTTFTNLFSQFVKKVGAILTPTTTSVVDIKLNGRIKELQTIADTVQSELLDLKQKIKNVHPDLLAIVTIIIDPLIKEIGRDPPTVEKKDNTAHQVKIFSRYVDCIEKANEWAALRVLPATQLEKAMVQQTAKEFLSRIDRDVQVLQDYLGHAFISIEMSESAKNELVEKFMPTLSSKLQSLFDLKTHPTDFSIESFIKWRANADAARELIFGEVLHMIDGFSNEFLPKPEKEKESEHLKAIEIQLKELEQKTSEIATMMQSNLNSIQIKTCLTALEKVEVDAHVLNSNLYLSSENSERLEEVFEKIFHLRNQISIKKTNP